MSDKTFIRDWWLEGLLVEKDDYDGEPHWHPLYGPLPEHEVKRLRNYFLDTPDSRLIEIDPGLANYEDYRARHHETVPHPSSLHHRKAIVRARGIDPLVATSPMPKSAAANRSNVSTSASRRVAHPIISSQTKIRIKIKKK